MNTSYDGATNEALPVGTRLGEFEIVGLVGVGGFGIVYEADDHVLQRRVALKEYMPASLAARVGPLEVSMRSVRARDTFEAGRRSFVNEARLLAQFDHPSLIKVYRFWEANGTAYMVMPLYRGPTLRAALTEGRVVATEPWLRALLGPLLDALEHLHRANCFHRDIAPDNILLLDEGRPLLLDFGAARRVIGDATQDLTVILKPGFAPIEQYASGPETKQGPWTDVYALASVVYYCATGRTPTASVSRIMSDTLAPLEQGAGGTLSAAFCAAIDRAMRVRVEERTESIAALRRELGIAEAVASTLFVPAPRASGSGATQYGGGSTQYGSGSPQYGSGSPQAGSGATAPTDPTDLLGLGPGLDVDGGLPTDFGLPTQVARASGATPAAPAGWSSPSPPPGTRPALAPMTAFDPLPASFAGADIGSAPSAPPSASAATLVLGPSRSAGSAPPPRPGPAGAAGGSEPFAADRRPSYARDGRGGRRADPTADDGGRRLLPWLVVGVVVLSLVGGVGWVLWRTAQAPALLEVSTSGTGPTATGPAPGADSGTTPPSGADASAGRRSGASPGPLDAGSSLPPELARPTPPSQSPQPQPQPSPSPWPSPEASRPAPSPPSLPQSAAPSSYSGLAALAAVGALADPALGVTVTPERTRLRINRDRLQFKVRASEPGHVYVLMSGTRGDDLYLLFPNSADRNNRLEAGAEISLPRKGWEMVFEGPPGKDHFAVIVSPSAREFSDIGLREVGPFQEFVPDAAAAQFASRGGQAFVGRVRDCAPTDAACERFGAARFEIEETR